MTMLVARDSRGTTLIAAAALFLWLLPGAAVTGRADTTPAELVEAGVAAAHRNEFAQAIVQFDLALKQSGLSPQEQAVILDNRGSAFKKLGRLFEAGQDYARAQKLAPELPKPLHDRGIIHFFQGQFDAAAADLARFLQQVPDIASPYPHLWLYLAQARARHDLHGGNALEHTPFAELIAWPGPLLRLHRDILDVPTLLSFTGDRLANRHHEKQCDAYFHIGEYHLLRGDRGAARMWFRKAIATGMVYLDEYIAAQAEERILGQGERVDPPSLLELDPEAVLTARPGARPSGADTTEIGVRRSGSLDSTFAGPSPPGGISSAVSMGLRPASGGVAHAPDQAGAASATASRSVARDGTSRNHTRAASGRH
ncbi:MAG: hypothetical protein HQL66_07005 [Magnetococcales bacterium]|nr:hypothetical protein [Magnetococcales bacterium]